jgi:hypothetical protein
VQFFQRWASGLVLLTDDTNQVSPGGTCGALETRQSWVTARHCVPEGPAVYVMRGGIKEPVRAERISRHPDKDLAVIHLPVLEEPKPLSTQVYLPPRNQMIDGGDFVGFGYPVGEGNVPTERIMKGHFQRHMSYSPAHGGTYWAGELSVAVAGGASGAVLAYAHEPQRAVALVTTNAESSITVDSISDVDDNGNVYREVTKKVTAYGIALMIQPEAEWLRSVIEVDEREWEV